MNLIMILQSFDILLLMKCVWIINNSNSPSLSSMSLKHLLNNNADISNVLLEMSTVDEEI